MIRNVLFAYKTAHQVIWKFGGWKFLFAPLLISILLFSVLAGGCFLASSFLIGKVEAFIERLFELPDWLVTSTLVLFTLVFLAPFYIIFRSLVLIIYGPLLDKISAKTEMVIDGTQNEVEHSFIGSLRRPVFMLFFSVAGALTVPLISYAIGLIPIIGLILSPLLILPTNFFLSSLSYIDPYLDRSKYTIRRSFYVMFCNFFTLALFGSVGFLVTIIPIVGWFVGPTYSVVAGVALSIILHHRHEEQTTKKLAQKTKAE